LEQQFLDDMLDPKANLDPTTGLAKYNTSLDYFSFHYYNDFRNGTTSIPPSDSQWNAARQTTTLKAQTDLIRSKLAALGKPGTKLFVSDWGPSVDEGSDINYSHKGAAWAAAFLTEAVADHVAMGSYLIMEDAVGSNSGSPGQASLMHKDITNGVVTYYPKPAANVFKMFAMMTGTRRAVTLPTGSTNLGAFATSDANSAGVVIFNRRHAPDLFRRTGQFAVQRDGNRRALSGRRQYQQPASLSHAYRPPESPSATGRTAVQHRASCWREAHSATVHAGAGCDLLAGTRLKPQ
jgi:hypothetical protein